MDLPPLCLDIIAHHLCIIDEPFFRPKCDIIRDTIILSIVSKSMQQTLVPLIIPRIDPPTEFEKNKKSLKLVDLKMMCKNAHLHTSGNKGTLIERLEQYDSRCIYCGLRKSVLNDAKYSYNRFMYSYSNEYEPIINGSSNKRRELLKQSIQIYGSVENIKKYIQSVLNGKETRRNQLIAALKERNCVLRSDSVICNNYINCKGNTSLDLAVDTTEEMDFFYSRTNYNSLLQKYRHFYNRDHNAEASYWRRRDRYKDGEEDYESDSSEETETEEDRRIRAKKDALELWIKRGGDVSNLPRSLCV